MKNFRQTMMTGLAGIAGITGIVIASTGFAFAGETLDRIMDKKTLVISTDAEYPPQSSLNADNEFVGFDIDVGHAIAKYLGVEAEFVTPGWDVITAGHWSGRWDMSVGSMTPTKKRAEVLDFPAIYYFTPAALVVHEKNTSILSTKDASGHKVGVGVSTTYESYLKKNLVIDAENVPEFSYIIDDADIRTYDTDLLALDDLRLGDGVRLDAAFTALPTVLEAKKKGYPIKIVGPEALFMEPLAIATDKGDAELNAKIKEAVSALRADGTLSRLSQKWYGGDLTQ
ncbi:transporter substrate-binding domain-containing protein [uncultured Kiloniella sp.]|uniref:transporter substrate-binding domain-containing protein n=1 Tax=uncultured Kiloniella sp. TaxID=1133091 RepID=UPI0026062C50|nr:transporter substrate-binding domain-containing protein [uncultured Kiloniella sp.]